MAKGKKSFVLYADQRECFDSVPDEVAGKLIKHIFAYVNDENPITEEALVNALFIGIKSSLKRDLKKWEGQLEQRREAGKKSAEIRKKKREEEMQRALTSVEFRGTKEHEETRKATDSVSVSVSDSVSDSDNTKYYYEKDNLKLSEEEKEKICQKYDILILDEYISRVENWNKKHKVKSLYLTVLNWIRKDEKQNQTLNANQQTQSPDGVQQWKPIRDATF